MAAKTARKRKAIPPPPPETASDDAKAAYYEKYSIPELIDAGYFVEEGIFQGGKCLVDLRPERGLVSVPVAKNVARKLYQAAVSSGCTPSALATRLLGQDLAAKGG